MLGFLTRTRNDFSLLVVRLALGGVMFAHGAQKVLGVWGGNGLKPSYEYFSAGFGSVVAILVIAAEFLGSIGLIVGLFGRFAAAGIAAVMVGAIYNVHWAHGFFMNWFGNAAGEGFEYHILAIAMALAIVFRGSGALSLDRWIGRGRG